MDLLHLVVNELICEPFSYAIDGIETLFQQISRELAFDCEVELVWLSKAWDRVVPDVRDCRILVCFLRSRTTSAAFTISS
ncbi:hypothetical protein BpHYR1_028646 [Brachionus plicatilis]|uniref:Uncharacterized protein n=1 Tax=Brachionus plicatilis TaxID=10195 RepID=A0A3M7RDG7_BRAPC|nr:hypothetical protein BpHYR1_028646 [Brachionus plicatilis]